eukprot:551867-Lingulodinium_polyedra.AAC.1
MVQGSHVGLERFCCGGAEPKRLRTDSVSSGGVNGSVTGSEEVRGEGYNALDCGNDHLAGNDHDVGSGSVDDAGS